jgi:DNA-binding response OmpR family regulator
MSKVLIIDDDVDVCEAYADILNHKGYEVHTLNSGAKAFRTLPKLVPDIVLLDMRLPDVSGALLLSFIRRFSRLSHTRVIIISGYTDLGESAKAIWGADLLLTKPISAKQLIEAVATYS